MCSNLTPISTSASNQETNILLQEVMTKVLQSSYFLKKWLLQKQPGEAVLCFCYILTVTLYANK